MTRLRRLLPFLALAALLAWSCGDDSPTRSEPWEDTTEVFVADLPGDVTMDFVWIEPGTLAMGSPGGGRGRVRVGVPAA
ncbi:MAG: hypothetical protein ABIL09_25620 [Gemmatimonadota bacterium]